MNPQQPKDLQPEPSSRSSQPAVHAPVTTHSKVCHVNHIALDTNQSPSEPTYRGPDAFDVERRLEHAQRLPADVTCEAPPYVLPLGSDMYRQHHTGTNAPSSALVADDWIATQTHAVFQPLPTYIPTDNEGGFAAWPQLDPRNHHPYNTYTPVGLSPTPLEGPTKSNQLGSGLQPAPVTERPWAQSFVNDHNSMAPSSNTQTSVPIQYPSTYFNRNDSLGPHNLLQTQIADGFESEAGHLELHETQRQTQRNIKRRSAFKPEQRDETRKTRRLKACIRCHMQKIRVSDDRASHIQ